MKHTTTTLFLAATLCAGALVMPQARAQFYSWSAIPDYSYLVRSPASLKITQEIGRESQNTARESTGGVRKTTPKKALTTTTYRESPAVSKQVLTRFTDWVATKANATDAAAIRRDFENDMLGRWAKESSENGLHRGDVADALTAYWVTNWMIANRVTSDPTPAQVRAVRRLFVSVLSSTPAFAKATNAQRQEMAEGFIYNTVLQSSAFGQVFHTGDKALLKSYSDGRAASFKQEMGFDLRTVRLTDAGFAAKS